MLQLGRLMFWLRRISCTFDETREVRDERKQSFCSINEICMWNSSRVIKAVKKCSIAADTVSSIALNGSFQYHKVIKQDRYHGGCLIKAGTNWITMKSACTTVNSIAIIVLHRCTSAEETECILTCSYKEK